MDVSIHYIAPSLQLGPRSTLIQKTFSHHGLQDFVSIVQFLIVFKPTPCTVIHKDNKFNCSYGGIRRIYSSMLFITLLFINQVSVEVPG